MSLRHSLLAVLVMLIWGTNFVVIDAGLDDVSPLLFLAMRFTFVAFPLVLFVPKPRVRLRVILQIGLFMSFGQFSLLYISMSLGMPAGLASLLLQAQVIFTIVLGSVVLHERPTRRQAAGATVGTVGLLLVVVAHGAIAPILPLAVLLGAASCWAIGNVLSRRAGIESGFALVIWSALVVPIPALGLALVLDGPTEFARAATGLSAVAIASTTFTVVGASLFGFGVWNSLLARYPASAVVPFVLLVPVIGLMSAWVLLHETPVALEIVGGAIMLLGVAAATTRRGAAARATTDIGRPTFEE